MSTWTASQDKSPQIRAVLILLFVGTLVRLIFAASTGLGIDETYTVATSRTLAWSVYDHPPMAWWLVWLSTHVFHSTAPLVVRLPFVLLFAVTTWQMFRLTTLLFGPRAGYIAALILNVAPVLGATTASWVLPDGPLLAALVSGALCLTRVLLVPGTRPSMWLAAGVFAGLAMLSKYHGVMLLFGAGLFVLTVPAQRRWLLTPWPYLGCGVALALFSPVILWNMDHGWASFAFQSQRAQTSVFRPWMPVLVMAGQAAFLLPWIWIGLVRGAWRSARKGPTVAGRWLLLCLGVAPVVGFTLVSAVSREFLFHWAMPGYLLWIPLLAADLAGGGTPAWLPEATQRVWAKVSVGLVTGLALVVSAISLVPWPAALQNFHPALPYPLMDQQTWADVRTALKARGQLDQSGLVVAANNWHDAGKLDYALGGALPVTVLSPDAREYGILSPLVSYVGRDMVVIVPLRRAAETQARLVSRFAKVDRQDDIVLTHAGQPMSSTPAMAGMAVFYGTAFHSAP